jgi:hypothetical protein
MIRRREGAGEACARRLKPACLTLAVVGSAHSQTRRLPSFSQHAVTCTPSTRALTLTTTTTTTTATLTRPIRPPPRPSHGGLSCASVPSLVLPSQPCRPLHRPHRTIQAGRPTVRGRTSLACPALISQAAHDAPASDRGVPGAHRAPQTPARQSWPARGICTAPSGWERITPRALYPRFDNSLAHRPICTNRQPRLVLGTPTRTPCSVRLHLRLAALVRPRFLELILAGAPLASPLPLCSSPSLPKLSFLMPAGPVASSLDMFVH